MKNLSLERAVRRWLEGKDGILASELVVYSRESLELVLKVGRITLVEVATQRDEAKRRSMLIQDE
jgi:hypothetical protein